MVSQQAKEKGAEAIDGACDKGWGEVQNPSCADHKAACRGEDDRGDWKVLDGG